MPVEASRCTVASPSHAVGASSTTRLSESGRTAPMRVAAKRRWTSVLVRRRRRVALADERGHAGEHALELVERLADVQPTCAKAQLADRQLVRARSLLEHGD